MLKVEREHDIAIWTMARPEAKNALSYQMMDELMRNIAQAVRDKKLRAVILTGEGDTFASGADLRELRAKKGERDAEQLADVGRNVCRGLATLDVPVIAALQGPAIGGGAELAIACDLRIADDRARFCFKHVRMGVTPAWGTTARLLAICGAATTARLLYTAHEIRAMEARALRLVDYVTDNGACVATALAWALDIAHGSPTAVAEVKLLMREAAMAAEQVRQRERERFIATWTGADHQEAVEAFFASRAPVWKERG
jgi:enoyl-CoA hydratase/carnithine racemase